MKTALQRKILLFICVCLSTCVVSCSEPDIDGYETDEFRLLYFMLTGSNQRRLELLSPAKNARIPSGSVVNFSWQYIGYTSNDPSEMNAPIVCRETVTGERVSAESRFRYYRLQIAASDFFDDLVFSANLTTQSYQTALSLPKAAYYWRVILVFQLQDVSCRADRKYIKLHDPQLFIIE